MATRRSRCPSRGLTAAATRPQLRRRARRSTRPAPRRFYGPSALSFGLDATDDADGGALGDGAPRLAAPAPLPIGAAQAVVAVLDSSLAWSRVALELTFTLSAALDAGGTVILRLPGFGGAGGPLALNDTDNAGPGT